MDGAYLKCLVLSLLLLFPMVQPPSPNRVCSGTFSHISKMPRVSAKGAFNIYPSRSAALTLRDVPGPESCFFSVYVRLCIATRNRTTTNVFPLNCCSVAGLGILLTVLLWRTARFPRAFSALSLSLIRTIPAAPLARTHTHTPHCNRRRLHGSPRDINALLRLIDDDLLSNAKSFPSHTYQSRALRGIFLAVSSSSRKFPSEPPAFVLCMAQCVMRKRRWWRCCCLVVSNRAQIIRATISGRPFGGGAGGSDAVTFSIACVQHVRQTTTTERRI